MKTLIAAATLLTIASQPAQAWTCLPFKSIRPHNFSSMDVDYFSETGWTIILHYSGGQIRDWHDWVVIKNIDDSQWRGTPHARLLPRLEGWSAAGKLHLDEDGVMNYTEQTYDPLGKLYDQVDLKCHKELIS